MSTRYDNGGTVGPARTIDAHEAESNGGSAGRGSNIEVVVCTGAAERAVGTGVMWWWLQLRDAQWALAGH